MSDPQNPEAARPTGASGDLDADVAIEEPDAVSPDIAREDIGLLMAGATPEESVSA